MISRVKMAELCHPNQANSAHGLDPLRAINRTRNHVDNLPE